MVADATSMGDEETEAASNSKIYTRSGSKKDGSKDVTYDGQGRHRKIKQ